MAELAEDAGRQPSTDLASNGQAPRRRAGRRRLLIVVLCAIVAVGTASAIGKAAGYAGLVDRLEEGDLRWLPVLAAGQLMAYVGYIFAYRATVRVEDGPQLPLGMTTRIVGASFGAYAIASGIGSLGVDYWALRRAGADHHVAFSRVVAFKTLEWAVLSAMVFAAAAVMLAGVGGPASTRAVVAWLVAIPTCWMLARWFSSPRRVTPIADPRAHGFRGVFADTIRSVSIVRRVVTAPRRHVEALAGAVVYWAGDLVTLGAGLRAFGVAVDVPALIVGYASGYAVTMLPLPFGGVGGVDAGMTYALTLVDVPLGGALLGVFAYRFFSFWLPLAPGVLLSATIKRVYDDLPTVAFPAAGRPHAGTRPHGRRSQTSSR